MINKFNKLEDIVGSRNKTSAKKLEWLVSTLLWNLETAILRSRAHEQVLRQNAGLLQEAERVRASAPFQSEETEYKALRNRVLAAIRQNNVPEIFGSLGDFLGKVHQADRGGAK